jgi:hypothetical protein
MESSSSTSFGILRTGFAHTIQYLQGLFQKNWASPKSLSAIAINTPASLDKMAASGRSSHLWLMECRTTAFMCSRRMAESRHVSTCSGLKVHASSTARKQISKLRLASCVFWDTLRACVSKQWMEPCPSLTTSSESNLKIFQITSVCSNTSAEMLAVWVRFDGPAAVTLFNDEVDSLCLL